jgi:hypothetical protein
VPVRVWTSEGVTLPTQAFIVVKAKRNYCKGELLQPESTKELPKAP